MDASHHHLQEVPVTERISSLGKKEDPSQQIERLGQPINTSLFHTLCCSTVILKFTSGLNYTSCEEGISLKTESELWMHSHPTPYLANNVLSITSIISPPLLRIF